MSPSSYCFLLLVVLVGVVSTTASNSLSSASKFRALVTKLQEQEGEAKPYPLTPPPAPENKYRKLPLSYHVKPIIISPHAVPIDKSKKKKKEKSKFKVKPTLLRPLKKPRYTAIKLKTNPNLPKTPPKPFKPVVVDNVRRVPGVWMEVASQTTRSRALPTDQLNDDNFIFASYIDEEETIVPQHEEVPSFRAVEKTNEDQAKTEEEQEAQDEAETEAEGEQAAQAEEEEQEGQEQQQEQQQQSALEVAARVETSEEETENAEEGQEEELEQAEEGQEEEQEQAEEQEGQEEEQGEEQAQEETA